MELILTYSGGIVSTALGKTWRRGSNKVDRWGSKLFLAGLWDPQEVTQICFCFITCATKMPITGLDLQFHFNWTPIVQRLSKLGAVDVE